MNLTDFVQMLIFALVMGSIYAIVAIGLNLIFGVMKVLNVAHGDILMLSAYGTFWMFTLYGIDPLISMVIMTPIFFSFGFAIYWLLIHNVVKRSASAVEITFTSLLIFFGLSIFIENLALIMWKADFRGITYLEKTINVMGISLVQIHILTILIAFITIITTHIFLTKTYFGKAIRATSQNRKVAALMGIHLDRINAFSFSIGLVLAMIAGSLVSLTYTIYPYIGVPWTMRALTVIVLGGLGSFNGALIGAIILGLAESFGSYLIGSAWREAISYAILISILLVKPSGLLGRER